MHVLYVASRFPILSQSFVLNEIAELLDRGHEISVFSYGYPKDQLTHSEFDDLDIPIKNMKYPTYYSIYTALSTKSLSPKLLQQISFIDSPKYHASCLYFFEGISNVICNERSIDLIHAHFAWPDRLAVTYAAAYHEIPCTVTAHASEIFSPPSLRQLQRVCSRFDHVVVPSEYNKRYLNEKIGVDTDMSVVPATTSIEKFDPSDGCISGRLLTVARLVDKKGHEYAIDAVADLIECGYDVDYHIIGTGERESFLRSRVQERGIEDTVEFLGHVSDERLHEELHDAELFVLPCVITADGDRDITPVALREAMATETACVSTTISAIPEVITDGHDGILVEPNDVSALAKAISALLNNQSQRRTLGENARKTIQTTFDITAAVDQLEDVFTSVVD